MTSPSQSNSAPSKATQRGEAVADYVDERFGIYKAKGLVRKIFPEHWSFMFGEMALYSFVILLLTGIYLTLFFKPSMGEVVYHGSYVPLKNIRMSEAYASTLRISFDIRGGLLVRQIHHWAALTMIAAASAHLLRHFFTGSFRKPREINWLIGFVLLVLLVVEGFAGYSLPDDLLSGTGLRIAEGVVLAIPLVGTYLTTFLFGGEFPGTDVIPRLYTVHILLIPGVLLALVVVHVLMVGVHKHTQYRGAGHTEENVVGQPLMPVYVAKAGGFFFLVFGVIAFCAAVAQINPIWDYGPFRPDQVSAGSQPDWYMGFLEGALRIFPNWEVVVAGHTLSLNVLLPAVVLPGIMAMVVALWPFLEAWVTKDRREHHLLDRPREHPTRTGVGVALVALYIVLMLGGANDILATHLHLSINQITWMVRIGFFVVPVVAFVATKRICLGLQHRDRDKLLHGRETGTIRRLPHGEYVEDHETLDTERTWLLVSREVKRPLEAPTEEQDGVPNPELRKERLRYRLSRWLYGQQVEVPTPEEFLHAQEHIEAVRASSSAQAVTGTPAAIGAAEATRPDGADGTDESAVALGEPSGTR